MGSAVRTDRTYEMASLYQGFGGANLPGTFNVFYLPSDVGANARDCAASIRMGDGEGMVESSLRLSEAPFTFFTSSVYLTDFVNNLLKFKSGFSLATSLGKWVPILGSIICGIETVVECAGLRATRSMIKDLDMSELDTLTKLTSFIALKQHFQALARNPSCLTSILTPEDLNSFRTVALQNGNPLVQACSLMHWKESIKDRLIAQKVDALYTKYCERTFDVGDLVAFSHATLRGAERNAEIARCQQELYGAKDRRLIRRVYPRAAREMYDTLPTLVRQASGTQTVSDRSLWKMHSLELLKDLNTQAQKNQSLHLVGLIASLINLVGLICLLYGLPAAWPLIIVGGVLALMQYGATKVMMPTRGWDFELKYLVPESIRNGQVQRKVCNAIQSIGSAFRRFIAINPQRFTADFVP